MSDDVYGHSIVYLRSGNQVYGFRIIGNVDLKKAQEQLHLEDPLELATDEEVEKETCMKWCVDYRLKKFFPQASQLSLTSAW
jgi:hypothetical protein